MAGRASWRLRIRYPGRGAPNLDAAYFGERSLLASLRLILAQPQLRAESWCLPG